MTAPLDDAAVTALVKELRERSVSWNNVVPDIHDRAADALERLAADLAAARAEIDEHVDHEMEFTEGAVRAEAEREHARAEADGIAATMRIYMHRWHAARAETERRDRLGQDEHRSRVLAEQRADLAEAQVAAVRALPEHGPGPDGFHSRALRNGWGAAIAAMRAALDSAGQTEGERP